MKRFLVFALVCFVFTLPAQATTILDGKTLNYQYYFSNLSSPYGNADNGDKLVGAGVEVSNVVDGRGPMDIYDDGFYISFTSVSSFAAADYNGFILTDIFDAVTDFTKLNYTLETNMVGLSLSDLYMTENELGFNFQGLTFSTDTYVKLNISNVPLPAAAWLFGSGLIGLIGISRKKSMSAA